MQITYYGHSCFLLEVGQGEKKYKLLFDPFVTGNPTAEKHGISIQTLSDAQPDYIFLSHAHGDHSGDAEAVSRETGAPIIGVWEIYDYSQTIYYAGDTALTVEMELVAERYQLDLAILPIGGNFTMDVEDAVEAALLLDVSHVMGVHYNTFPPIAINDEEAKRAFDEVGVTLHLLSVGKAWEVPREKSSQEA